ncbi:hypothetical protein OG239_26905 [Streptomyces sp. NBC_00868]|uniref:hypothetical protein n=1 Tax=unclassified Streptomyces TaxID=2593676 RepID=UPI003249BA06|nr:hypothetical protein OG239_26905 [Streptomyces sp. NBC_00868]
MTVREIRAAARLIGRRNALRYLAIGVGASVLAACAGEGKDKAATPAPGAPGTDAPASGASGTTAPGTADPAAPTPAASQAPTPAPTVAGRAFDAFIKGSWTIESTTPGGHAGRGKATVNADGGGNGGWSIEWEGAAGTWRGGFLLRGGHLVLDVYEAPKGVQRLTGGEALTVPATVGETASLTFPWKPPGHRNTNDGQKLSVEYAKNTLTIRHIETSGSTTTHVCTRA